MAEETIELDLLLAGGSQAILERTLIAEYLLGKGYLMSDLKELPPQVTKSLMGEAYRFVARRLAELGLIEKFQFRLSFSLN
jgi:superfamily I DNA and/or RNA helicase